MSLILRLSPILHGFRAALLLHVELEHKSGCWTQINCYAYSYSVMIYFKGLYNYWFWKSIINQTALDRVFSLFHSICAPLIYKSWRLFNFVIYFSFEYWIAKYIKFVEREKKPVCIYLYTVCLNRERGRAKKMRN